MISLYSEQAARSLEAAFPELYRALMALFQSGKSLDEARLLIRGLGDALTPLQQNVIELALPWLHAEFGGELC